MGAPPRAGVCVQLPGSPGQEGEWGLREGKRRLQSGRCPLSSAAGTSVCLDPGRVALVLRVPACARPCGGDGAGGLGLASSRQRVSGPLSMNRAAAPASSKVESSIGRPQALLLARAQLGHACGHPTPRARGLRLREDGPFAKARGCRGGAVRKVPSASLTFPGEHGLSSACLRLQGPCWRGASPAGVGVPQSCEPCSEGWRGRSGAWVPAARTSTCWVCPGRGRFGHVPSGKEHGV